MRERVQIFRKISAVCLGAALLFSVGTMPMRAEASEDGSAVPTLAVTKEIQTSEWVPDAPAGTAVFTFQAVGVQSVSDGELNTTLRNSMPGIPDVEIIFDGTETGTVTEGLRSIVKESGDVVQSMRAADFQNVGYYHYTLSEKQNTFVLKDGEVLTNSEASYEVVFSVLEPGRISGAAVTRKTDDQGGSETTGQKVEGTPGNSGLGNGIGNDLRFVSQYSSRMTADPLNPVVDPENPIQANGMWLGKIVTGELADMTRYFPFSVKIQNPDWIVPGTGAYTYRAYIMEYDGTSWSYVTEEERALAVSEDAVLDVDHGYYLTFAAGTGASGSAEKNVNLAHHTALCFTDLAFGAKMQCTEAASVKEDGYTVSVKLLANGQDRSAASADTGVITIGARANAAFFTNDLKAQPITGIMMNNLPYMVLLAAAVAGLILYVAAKSYKKRRNDGR